VHELAVGQAILDIARERAEGHSVERVSVRIGHFRQVVPDALQFAWQMLTDGTDLDGCALDMPGFERLPEQQVNQVVLNRLYPILKDIKQYNPNPYLVLIEGFCIGSKDIDTGEQLKTGEEKPATSHLKAPGAASVVTETARETVSQDAFDRMIAEFSDLANVIGSIASLIVRDHVRTLGESMSEFPQKRLTELLDSLSGDISDDKLKADFQERLLSLVITTASASRAA
jgi:hypothetical protein